MDCVHVVAYCVYSVCILVDIDCILCGYWLYVECIFEACLLYTIVYLTYIDMYAMCMLCLCAIQKVYSVCIVYV